MSVKPKKKKKNGLLALDPDCDLSSVFVENENNTKTENKDNLTGSADKKSRNKHGIRVLDARPEVNRGKMETAHDFETLLAQSFKRAEKASLPKSKPMPVHKRIKKYPPVEKQLDLHGCKAVKAQIRARNFILNYRHQGFFTIKIIVGKGRHSQMGPVLPDVIEDLVIDMKKQGHVLWFEWEKKSKSRSGAIIVYLKQFD